MANILLTAHHPCSDVSIVVMCPLWWCAHLWEWIQDWCQQQVRSEGTWMKKILQGGVTQKPVRLKSQRGSMVQGDWGSKAVDRAVALRWSGSRLIWWAGKCPDRSCLKSDRTKWNNTQTTLNKETKNEWTSRCITLKLIFGQGFGRKPALHGQTPPHPLHLAAPFMLTKSPFRTKFQSSLLHP